MSYSTKDYKLGKGIVYLDELDANQNEQGFRDIGNTTGFTIGISNEKFENYSSRGGVRQKDLDILLQVDRTSQIVVTSASIENLALFINGDISDIVQGAGSVSDEAITVKNGLSYQIGASLSAPTGVRGISSVVVQDDSDTTTYEFGEAESAAASKNGWVDLANSVLHVFDEATQTAKGAASNISDGDVLHVDYDTAANTRKQIKTSSVVRQMALKFVADNTTGNNDSVYIPLVSVQPNGEIQFIGDDLVAITLDIGISKKDGYEAVYIDGEPV